MDSIRDLQKALYSPEARARRQARREARRAQVYSQVQAAMGTGEDDFASRYADMWSLGTERESTRKIQGNAAASATMWVSEALGEFDIQGTVKAHYAGMVREAGYGGHGITDGLINVEVEVTPIQGKGMTQVLEVPVQVRHGRMLQPGLFRHQGVPYVLSQSAIDEVMRSGLLSKELKVDRKTLYSPPKNSNDR